MDGYCSAGECRIDCVDPVQDCPIGDYFCNTIGQCQESSGGSGPGVGGQGGAGQGGAQGGAGPGSGGDGGAGPANGGGSASGGAGGGGTMLGELELCATGQCASGLSCKEMYKGGPSRCARSCTSHAVCPVGTRCIDDGGGGRCVGNDTGRTCSVANDCNFACHTGPGYCTNECVSGSDCPNGYACATLGALDVCVKVEADCDGGANAKCYVQAACDQSANLYVASCTAACNTAADCPQRALPLTPWTCDGLCRRPADVVGPLPGGATPTEWYCDQNLCNDALHIDFLTGITTQPGPTGTNCFPDTTAFVWSAAPDACVNSCRYQGDCPHGFACVGVGTLTGAERFGVCLPAGNFEPGVACTSNTQCAFGYCVNNVCSRDCTADGVCLGGQTCVNNSAPSIEGMTHRRCE